MNKQNNNTEKLTDKAFSRLLFTSILGIVVCIVCLCSGTYAWFTESLPSQGNEIRSADECLLEITVMDEGTELADIENGVVLEAGKSYTVTLTLPAGTASGYGLINAGGETYYTDYIVRHNESTAQVKTFILKVNETQTVTFTTRWGIYTRDSDVVNGELIIP